MIRRFAFRATFRGFATPSIHTIKTPAMGESITEGTLTQWTKSNFNLIPEAGDYVSRDELIATIETDKVLLF